RTSRPRKYRRWELRIEGQEQLDFQGLERQRQAMKAVFANEAEIIRIGEGLFSCTLPRTEWTHAAHFAAALWLMRYRSDLDAAGTMPDLIRAYNESVGRV